jgi:hypothetical protein
MMAKLGCSPTVNPVEPLTIVLFGLFVTNVVVCRLLLKDVVTGGKSTQSHEQNHDVHDTIANPNLKTKGLVPGATKTLILDGTLD